MNERRRTGVSLDTSSNLSSTDVVEKGDILTEYGAEVCLTKSLSIDLTGVDPNDHVDVCAEEHANAWRERER